jgi:hypothetical protein
MWRLEARGCNVAEPNEIVLENLKPGNPEREWGLSSGPSANIEGFSTDISADIGERVDFKINTDAANYRIDVYRPGGNGAREVATIEHHAAGAIDQPPPIGKAPDSLGCPAVPVDGTVVADYSTEPDQLGLISIHCFFLEQ